MTGQHLSKDKLQRHHDGDLSEREAAEAQQHLHSCPQCEAELASFERLGDMLRWSTDDATAAAEVDFNQMFAQIEKAVQQDRESSTNVVPLHPGSGHARPRSRVLPTLGALALAAAAVLMLTRKEKPTEGFAEVAMLDVNEHTELKAVKFGKNAGQVFAIPLSERESATVVWIDDDEEETEEE